MYSQQPALIDLQSIWFTVFFKKKKEKKSALRCFEIKSGQQVMMFYIVRSVQVAVCRKESDIVCASGGIKVSVHTASQK